ncbi:MAG TPA: hypothetical protein VES19_16305 [Candidatus Limnocylindrales bacterium]|nr:hypothetical protein [Candidatus Limnocylindrales bacterium]
MDRSVPRAGFALAATLGLATLLGGCGGLAAAPTPEPSSACMGFNLTIFNGIDATVEVRINGVVAGTVEAGTESTIFETMLAGQTEMPWTVEFVDRASGALLGTRTVSRETGTEAAWIDVERGPGGTPTVGEVNGRSGC